MAARILKWILLTLVVVVVFGPDVAAGEINSKNWLKHPKIKEIRNIFQATQKGIASKEIICKKITLEPSEPYQDDARELCSDKAGVARKYVRSGGSDDSATTRTFYYDNRGRLRFVFVTGDAVNDTEIQHRIYFDVKVKRIWEIQKLVKGPGYTFPNPWPESDIVLDAQAAFSGEKG